MSLPPWLVLSLVIALALSLGFQLLTGRYGWRVLLYWAAIFAGFIAGELAAESAGISLLRVGDLRLAADFAGALLVVAVLWLLRL